MFTVIKLSFTPPTPPPLAQISWTHLEWTYVLLPEFPTVVCKYSYLADTVGTKKGPHEIWLAKESSKVESPAKAIAIIDLILRAVGLGNVPGVLAGGIVFDIIFAIMCILLIVGVLKDIKWFCLAWVIYAVVYLIILLILAIVYTVMTVAEYIDDDKGVSLGAMIGGLVISWLIVTIVVSFIVYCVLCVYSHYQNLRDGIVEGDVTVTRTEIVSGVDLAVRFATTGMLVHGDVGSPEEGGGGTKPSQCLQQKSQTDERTDDQCQGEAYMVEAAYSGIVFDLIFVIFCILLIVGAAKDNKWLCLAWVPYAVTYVIVQVVISVQYTMAPVQNKPGQDTQEETEQFRTVGLAIPWIIMGIVTALVVYCIIVVLSHYQNLRNKMKGQDRFQATEMVSGKNPTQTSTLIC
uniref:Uncharacterized protein n=1 Tax=Branchiostoma floridae TaxID=7739 RepID=C3XY94_BRAFL|eukprot:XP_002610769.1 hypothetical protein BRAFLDRAFT_91561 [Branchiostoma floridae]